MYTEVENLPIQGLLNKVIVYAISIFEQGPIDLVSFIGSRVCVGVLYITTLLSRLFEGVWLRGLC